MISGNEYSRFCNYEFTFDPQTEWTDRVHFFVYPGKNQSCEWFPGNRL